MILSGILTIYRKNDAVGEDSVHEFPQLMISGGKENGNVTSRYSVHATIKTRVFAPFDSWNAKCPVLCHLFRCLDSSFKEDIHCHPAFIIGDIGKATQKKKRKKHKTLRHLRSQRLSSFNFNSLHSDTNCLWLKFAYLFFPMTPRSISE